MASTPLTELSNDALNRLLDRLCNQQGALGDAEHIDDAAVERIEARIRQVDNEIKRRKGHPHD